MGVFIYKTKGTFPNNFIIEAQDVLLMAKGSTAEVGYVTDGELLGDICDLGYEEFSRGLIHSHCNMGTSFSGTDTTQLKLAAETGPYYLSVVVNNHLEVTAKVAIKSTIEGEYYSHFKNLFGKKVKDGKKKTFKKESYEIIECEVEIEKPQYMIDVDERIKTKLQHYVTPTYHKPVGEGNEINGKGDTSYIKDNMKNNYGGKSNLFKTYDGYYTDQYDLFSQGTNKKSDQAWRKDWQRPASNPTITAPDNSLIKAALKKYCFVDGNYLATDECLLNIINDSEHYGISMDDYEDCLRKFLCLNMEMDKKLIKEFEELKKIKTTIVS